MFGWFNKKKLTDDMAAAADNTMAAGEKPLKEEAATDKAPKKKSAKPKKPRVKKPETVEPKVDILKFDFDPKDPRLGSIELDWNSEFIQLLAAHGYSGETEEEVIDKWLNDVCRNIADSQFQGSNVKLTTDDAKFVNKIPLNGSRTEIL